MHYRELGRTGWKSFNCFLWRLAIGGSWGNVDDKDSLAALHRSIDLGVNFIDTADVMEMGVQSVWWHSFARSAKRPSMWRPRPGGGLIRTWQAATTG